MPDQAFNSLKMNVSREEAIAAFEPNRLVRWAGTRPLRSVAELYVPFRLYQVVTRRGNTSDTRWMALDMLFGGLDPFTFAAVPGESEMVSVTTRNRPDPRLEDEAARSILRTKVQRVLFQTGFFRMAALDIEITPVIDELHMPYWVGLFGAGSKASIKVLDATRRVMEGAKFRHYVSEWLAS
jgi:hypothetical protein